MLYIHQRHGFKHGYLCSDTVTSCTVFQAPNTWPSRKSGVLGSIPGLATYFRFSFLFTRRAVVSYWRKYVHKVLVNRLGGLSLPRKSVVRLTDRPDMTLDVYRGRKITIQQQYNNIDVRLLADCYSLSCTKDLASNYGVDVKILLTLDRCNPTCTMT